MDMYLEMETKCEIQDNLRDLLCSVLNREHITSNRYEWLRDNGCLDDIDYTKEEIELLLNNGYIVRSLAFEYENDNNVLL